MVESWKDLVAEIRKRAAVAARQPADAVVHHSAVAGLLNELADRVEEAEIGNTAKMRETLKWLLKDIDEEAHLNGEMANADAIRTAEILKALEGPPRNCDLPLDKKELWEKFENEFKGDWAADWGWAYANWLLEEAKK